MIRLGFVNFLTAVPQRRREPSASHSSQAAGSVSALANAHPAAPPDRRERWTCRTVGCDEAGAGEWRALPREDVQ